MRSCCDGFDQPKVFQFDKVFDHSASQREVFEAVARPVVESALQGFNGAIIAYGQTGTGKTYTMEGLLGDEDQMGIIPGVCKLIFEATTRAGASEDERACSSLHVNYIEIYNEELRDLLSERRDRIALRELAGGRLILGRDYKVESVADITRLLQRGKANRAVAVTRSNETSSRSHAVFVLHYVATRAAPAQPSSPSSTVAAAHAEVPGRARRVRSTLQLVDLAGSERLESQANSESTRLRESRKINKSLTALGLVIAALAERKRHVPYRDSKLTRLLQDSLGGNSNTVIIATVSPAETHRKETMCTLRYATGARDVTNIVVRNESEMRLAAAAAAAAAAASATTTSNVVKLNKCIGVISYKNARTTSWTSNTKAAEDRGGYCRVGRRGITAREDTFVRVGGRSMGVPYKNPAGGRRKVGGGGKSKGGAPCRGSSGGKRISGGGGGGGGGDDDARTSDTDKAGGVAGKPQAEDGLGEDDNRRRATDGARVVASATANRRTQTSPLYTGLEVPPLDAHDRGAGGAGATLPGWSLPPGPWFMLSPQPLHLSTISGPSTSNTHANAVAAAAAATHYAWPLAPPGSKTYASTSLPTLALGDRRQPFLEQAEAGHGSRAGGGDSPITISADCERSLHSRSIANLVGSPPPPSDWAASPSDTPHEGATGAMAGSSPPQPLSPFLSPTAAAGSDAKTGENGSDGGRGSGGDGRGDGGSGGGGEGRGPARCPMSCPVHCPVDHLESGCEGNVQDCESLGRAITREYPRVLPESTRDRRDSDGQLVDEPNPHEDIARPCIDTFQVDDGDEKAGGEEDGKMEQIGVVEEDVSVEEIGGAEGNGGVNDNGGVDEEGGVDEDGDVNEDITVREDITMKDDVAVREDITLEDDVIVTEDITAAEDITLKEEDICPEISVVENGGDGEEDGGVENDGGDKKDGCSEEDDGMEMYFEDDLTHTKNHVQSTVETEEKLMPKEWDLGMYSRAPELRGYCSEEILDNRFTGLAETRQMKTTAHGDGGGGGGGEEGGGGGDIRDEERVQNTNGGGDGSREIEFGPTPNDRARRSNRARFNVPRRCPSCHLLRGGHEKFRWKRERERVLPRSAPQEISSWRQRTDPVVAFDGGHRAVGARYVQEAFIPHRQLESLHHVKKGVFSSLDDLESDVQSIYHSLNRRCKSLSARPARAPVVGSGSPGVGTTAASTQRSRCDVGYTTVAVADSPVLPSTFAGSLAKKGETRAVGEGWRKQIAALTAPQGCLLFGQRHGIATATMASFVHAAGPNGHVPLHHMLERRMQHCPLVPRCNLQQQS